MSDQPHDPAEDYKVETTEDPHHDDPDVQEALSKETDDGKGGAVVPKSDFDSYEDEDADVETQEDDS